MNGLVALLDKDTRLVAFSAQLALSAQDLSIFRGVTYRVVADVPSAREFERIMARPFRLVSGQYTRQLHDKFL
jgi:hypothetical protein